MPVRKTDISKKEVSPVQGAGRKLKIMIVSATLYLGGLQKVVCILANFLAERHDVTVVYCLDTARRHMISEKCSVCKLPEYDSSAGRLEKAICIRKQARELRELKRRLDIDVAVSLGNIANCLNALSKGKERVVCCERCNPKQSWKRRLFLNRLFFLRADHVVFQSEEIRSIFGRRIRSKSTILKNPIIIPAPANDVRAKKIVALGRLAPQKNHALLIRSFALFHERFPEHRLFIYGEGRLEAQLARQIADLGLTEHVFLKREVPDVHEKIRDAEMFVLSSNFEGMSNALLECMSMGIACISTRCEGSVDVIRQGENGLLVDIGDEKAMAEAMCALAGDPDLRKRIEQQAKQDLKAFDKDTVSKDWERVILQCAAWQAPETAEDI